MNLHNSFSGIKRAVALGSFAVISLLAVGCGPRYVATVPPQTEVVPVAPYAGAVYVGNGYRWRRGSYVYVPGRYVAPRPGRVYEQGAWRSGPRGHYYVRGRWR